MSWSYYPGKSTRDWVRFVIGDTDENDQLLANEEIDAALTTEGSQYAAAAVCCEALAAKYSDARTKKVGPLTISGAERARSYLELAKRLRATVGRKVAAYAGGISRSDIDSVRDDTDRYEGAFREGMHDVPGTGTSELDEEELGT